MVEPFGPGGPLKKEKPPQPPPSKGTGGLAVALIVGPAAGFMAYHVFVRPPPPPPPPPPPMALALRQAASTLRVQMERVLAERRIRLATGRCLTNYAADRFVKEVINEGVKRTVKALYDKAQGEQDGQIMSPCLDCPPPQSVGATCCRPVACAPDPPCGCEEVPGD